MSYASFNGIPVLVGALTLPRVGVWSALVELDTSEAIDRQVDIEWGGLALKGTFLRGGLECGSLWCRVSGGAGGLGAEIRPSGFRRPTVSSVLKNILDQAGEQLSPSTPSDLLSRQLDWFALSGDQTAGQALNALAAATNTSWRVMPDGKVWMGTETWTPSGVSPDDVVISEVSLASSRVRVGMLDASKVLPGQTFGGIRVDRVEHVVTNDNLESVLWLDTSDAMAAIVAAEGEA